jgi:hypothetical protein
MPAGRGYVGRMTDALAPYYVSSPRFSSQLGGRNGIRGTVDSLLNELQVPATLDADGDWNLTNDAGQFLLFARDEDRKLVLRQKFVDLGDNLKKHASQMHALLLMNLDNEGACFASQMNQTTGKYTIVLTGQKSYDKLDRDEFLELLEAAFKLSKEFDDVVAGDDAPAPRAAAPAPPSVQPQAVAWSPDWYADPRGEARLRYWDGSAWTEHTAA